MTDQTTTEQTKDHFPDAGKVTDGASGGDPEKGVSTTDTPAEDEVISDHPTEGEPTDADAPDDGEPKGTEAKLRKRAQAAEAERDTLRTKLDTFQKQAVFDGLKATFNDPTDYFLRGGQVHTSEDGTIDVEAVMADAQRILDGAMHLRAGYGIPAPNPMHGSSGGGRPSKPELTWGDALRRK